MDTIGYDKLLTLTDSRYRLSTIVAKRAVQLKMGFPSLLARAEYPINRDGVSEHVVAIALQELLLGKTIIWGKDLPSDVELIRASELDKQSDPVYRVMNYDVTNYSGTHAATSTPNFSINRPTVALNRV
jgi:DNA-directed RNA polymerase subunit omega